MSFIFSLLDKKVEIQMVMIKSGTQIVIPPMDSNNEDFVAMAMASILVRPPGIPGIFGGVI